MNDDYKTIRTSAEVWVAVHNRHPNMVVFRSYSAPNGSESNPSRGVMFTSYGFKGFDYPFIQAETTWDINTEDTSRRINENSDYWLCFPNMEAQNET